jgi:hypothetical protein
LPAPSATFAAEAPKKVFRSVFSLIAETEFDPAKVSDL